MMTTFFLRFPSEAAALAAFAAVTGQAVADVAEVPSKVMVNGKLCDIDPIGVLSRLTGEVDTEGVPISEPMPGWHVNIWAPDDAVLPAALAPVRIFPESPSRVFG